MALSTSEAPRDAFVWVWLPGHTNPIPAGRLRFQSRGRRYEFGYGRSYLERDDAISLYEPELPLRSDWQAPPPNMSIASALRDAGPDSWGQRVILERLHGVAGRDADTTDLDQITYFLESGSNRIGGLDFQTSPEIYVPRGASASLDELHAAAHTLDQGRELNEELGAALLRGTSIGGARPKALIDVDGRSHIAKFSSASDPYPVVNAEALALELARRAGIDTTASFVTTSLGRDVLVIERFDRPAGGGRRIIVSALTMLGLDEMEGRYATYPDLLDVLRRTSTDAAVGRRLFERIVFNVAIGNNDDHARNHAAFWDGKALDLTPAYDLCPQIRSGETSSQALAFDREGNRDSSFAAVVAAAPVYGLTTAEGRAVVDAQVAAIEHNFDEAADLAKLTRAQRNLLWRRQILNPYASYGYTAS
ncbi:MULTISPECIES: type II toxin-antitoxin system HipA family toxin [Mycolicibacterium]|uniref:Phosphatidylinositol kinase n=2 Tax=Mycolicibacterium TaxID=1866885 RepID=A0A255DBU5_9MYCO|nr:MULTISPECIES: HipA domain-containing protein [Mycolicibacterium]MCV7174555.1 type II toxin-antitoxin system HipA family toxin [Mycolicibacterium sphagni]MCV7225171.1 type II toxin-antitoxin system HipA family toxin [Mycolicibacterium komossense]OYN74725.1 phosphatidylinositol kinase [Mycolicibacterium sphagni]